MNNQEIFDTVVTHLLTQKERSVIVDPDPNDNDHLFDTSCAYRGENNLKCAVGCLISDEAYSPDIERKTVEKDLVRDALLKSGISACTFPTTMLLLACHRIHDHHEPDVWAYELESLAMQYKLIFNPPTV